MPKNNRHGHSTILSAGDFTKLLKAIENPKHRLFLQIAWWTGERFGAICKLQVEDVYKYSQQPHESITFRAVTRKKSPKGIGKTRQVSIHPVLCDALRAYLPPLDGWLFPGKETHRPMCFRNADKFFRLALEKAGLDDRGISTHSFRRSFITRLNDQGVTLPVIQKITGHCDLKSLQRYIEVSDDQAKLAIARL